MDAEAEMADDCAKLRLCEGPATRVWRGYLSIRHKARWVVVDAVDQAVLPRDLARALACAVVVDAIAERGSRALRDMQKEGNAGVHGRVAQNPSSNISRLKTTRVSRYSQAIARAAFECLRWSLRIESIAEAASSTDTTANRPSPVGK